MKEPISTHYFRPEPFDFSEPLTPRCGVCGSTKEWIESTGEICGNPMLLDPPQRPEDN